MTEDILITSWQRGDGELRVLLRQWQGTTYLDIRNWWNNDGHWLPTKKGASVPAELVPELADAINQALAYIEGAPV